MREGGKGAETGIVEENDRKEPMVEEKERRTRRRCKKNPAAMVLEADCTNYGVMVRPHQHLKW